MAPTSGGAPSVDFYVKDTVSGEERGSGLTIPAHYYQFFAPKKKKYIMQAELVAAVAVVAAIAAGIRF